MIQLLVLDNARMAQALVDYLSTLGISCELTQSELGVSVWLADEQRLAQAQLEVKRFLAEPTHPATWKPPGNPAGPMPASTTARG